MFISANKTQNSYMFKKEDHENILYKNVTKTFKKAKSLLPKKINIEAKKITEAFSLDEKLNTMAK